MTAETLKPFLNLPNAATGDLKAHYAQKSAVKRGLLALGYILAVTLLGALIGVEIWHLNKTAELQRQVDDLKQHLYLRAREFNDYEFDNELFDGQDEYVYGSDLDPDTSDDVHREQEMNESGLSSSGIHEEDEDTMGSDEEERENLGIEDLRESNEDNEDDDDGIIIDDSVDINVAATPSSGTNRRVRSISAITRQGVPILDEPYVPRRNRTKQPHRIYEQLRQRPEEVVTPPTSSEMFRWDVQNRKTHTASHSQQSYGSISIRPYHHEVQQLRNHQSTTPMPVAYGPRTAVRHHSRNALNAGNPTKAPVQILNRMSRVQLTGGNMRKQLQPQPQRFAKVVQNPGTSQENVMAPEPRAALRQTRSQTGEPVAKAVHLVKQHPDRVSHPHARHRNWTAKDTATKHALDTSTTFAFDGEQLTIKEPGLYYLYAQVTYDNEFNNNGFKVMVDGKSHLSCNVHVQGKNTNACFTGGLVEIDSDDHVVIVVEDFDHGRNHVKYPDKTFFGAYKVGRLPPKTAKLRQRHTSQQRRHNSRVE